MARTKPTGSLQIKNFQIIRQVDLALTKNLIVVGGKNGQGKTSVLRAIHACIVGKSAVKDKEPVVRDGNQEGEVILSIGDIEIVRKFDTNDRWQVSFRRNGKVESSKVQDRLDTLVSRTTFDPSFLWDSKVTDKDRVRMFLDAIGVDISDIEGKCKDAYDARTEVGREIKRMRGWLDQNPIDMDAPDDPIFVEDLSRELAAAHKTNQAKMDVLSTIEVNGRQYEALKTGLARVREQIKSLQEQEAAILRDGKALRARTDELTANAEQMLEIDTDEITARMAQAEQHNAAYRSGQERRAYGAELAAAENKQETLTSTLAACDEEKAGRLKSAKLPLEGLEATEEGLYLHGHPISRASGRDRLTVALSVAIANADPDLPLVCCDGGEQFDPEWLPHVERMAEDAGVVIILTRVSTDAGCTVLMEDGRMMTVSEYADESAGLTIEDVPSVLAAPLAEPSELHVNDMAIFGPALFDEMEAVASYDEEEDL